MSLVLSESPRPGIRVLTLNRPDKRNALSWELVDELCAHLRELQDDRETRVVVLTGAGDIFCAGADLHEQFANQRADAARIDIGRADLWPLLETAPQVVIAGVHGAAVTGGFLLAYSCDIVVADESAIFQDTHAKFGITPTGGEVQRLRARLGPSRAAELLFTSRALDARTAQEWGVVSRVCANGTVLASALDYAEEIIANDPDSVRNIKRMLGAGLRGTTAAGMAMDEFTNQVGAANLNRSAESNRRIEEFLGARRSR